MSNIVSETVTVQMNLTEQKLDSSLESSNSSNHVNSTTSDSIDSKSATFNQPNPVTRFNKLPYQASHQVELLHLQAELDALFQQLQNLKQQRLSTADRPSELEESPVHALV